MKIDLGSREIRDVTEEDLERALQSVNTAEEEFLILIDEDRGNYFMQVAGSEDAFYVEYREETDDRHFCTGEKVSFQQALDLLKVYLRGDESFKTMVTWEKVEMRGGCSKAAAVFLLGVIIVTLMLAL